QAYVLARTRHTAATRASHLLWHPRREGKGLSPTQGGGIGVGPLRERPRMASVDVPVALLGYGTVGSAVDRLLREQAADIERATGHRLRGVKAPAPGRDRK